MPPSVSVKIPAFANDALLARVVWAVWRGRRPGRGRGHRHGRGGVFGDMVLPRGRPPKPLWPQPVEQRVERHGIIRRVVERAALGGGQRLGAAGFKRQGLNAETGGDFGEFLLQQPGDLRRVPAGGW